MIKSLFNMFVNFTRLQAIVPLQHHEILLAELPSAKRQRQAWRRLQASTMDEDQMPKVMTNRMMMNDEYSCPETSHIIQEVSDNLPRNFGKQIRRRPIVVALCCILRRKLVNCRNSSKTQDKFEIAGATDVWWNKKKRTPLKITSELRAITAQLPGIVTPAGKVKNYRLKTLQTRIAGADVKTPFYILLITRQSCLFHPFPRRQS